jgi:DNA mismatch repair protein MutS
MRQFLDIKEQHPDAIVLFRLGDFYEMFFDDAVVASGKLDLTLTTRDKGKEDAVPMCGVPHHAARTYVARLIELGHKVVIAEQVEDPKLAKGLVRRAVVRIVTPGVFLDEESLDPRQARYVAAVVAEEAGEGPQGAAGEGGEGYGVAYLDVTTGEFRATLLSADALGDELLRVAPREIVGREAELMGEGPLRRVLQRLGASSSVVDVPAAEAARATLEDLLTGVGFTLRPSSSASGAAKSDDKRDDKHGAGKRAAGKRHKDAAASHGRGPAASTPGAGASPSSPESSGTSVAAAPATSAPASAAPAAALRAAAAVLAYAQATQPGGSLPVVRLEVYQASDALGLDEAAVTNLELVETMIGKRKQGSLLEVIDHTATAPGARLLRRWLLFPLVDVAAIRRRQDAVAWLVARAALTSELLAALREIADVERLAGKSTLGVATPRDLGRLRGALDQLPALVARLRGEIAGSLEMPPVLDLSPLVDPTVADICARLAETLVEAPPSLLKDGGVIRAGVDPIIDECRRLADGGKDEILAIEVREREISGIASLKVRYNRVFGYYIEITRSQLGRVPDRYQRKQTVATGERYVTAELSELERKVLSAEETLASREAERFGELVREVAEVAPALAAAGAALAVLDSCASLAHVALRHGYVRPEVNDGATLEIREGRHPVIERLLPAGEFVPNDCVLDPYGEQLLLITGPNMAGKSTYMRQVAHLVILAQLGSFVPARSAVIGLCDRIFTRVGAADNLSAGDSTFMVEMRETAAILARATRRSLVVLDEVGRGTSTFDGLSIAWAVCEFLHDAVGARTLFATHYHELVALAESRPRVRNFSVAVREHRGEVVFLRRLVPGGASRSYGIEVARLAGLPRSVLARSRQLLAKLEGGAGLGNTPQLSLSMQAPVAAGPTPVELRLREIDLDRTTPLEALALLAELRRLDS